jgi:acyl-CoA thioesterase FadM
MEDFTFSVPIRVRFADTDARASRTMRPISSGTRSLASSTCAPSQAATSAARPRIEALTLEALCRYRRPVRFDDELVVHTRCIAPRGARFRYEYAIVRGDELVAEGHTEHACVDAATLRPTRVPEWLADAIRAAEAASSSA